MPYFFKLSDFFITSNRYKWWDDVDGVKNMVKDECKLQSKGGVYCLIYNLDSTDNIQPHVTTISGKTIRTFEYITTNTIYSDKLVHTQVCGKSNSAIRNFLLGLENNEHINNLYIHFTCESNIESIHANGLIHDHPDKILDKEYDGGSRQNRKSNKTTNRVKKNKRKTKRNNHKKKI